MYYVSYYPKNQGFFFTTGPPLADPRPAVLSPPTRQNRLLSDLMTASPPLIPL
jgi:hypothetical protein